MKIGRLACVVPLVSSFAAVAVPSAAGFGCTGHQVVAFIAEDHLEPHARAMVMQILAAAPIDPGLRRYCGDSGVDRFVDSSTWADDERGVRPETSGWHFVDIPRRAPLGDIMKYCPPSAGCILTAITSELSVLSNQAASPRERADALRFIIHLVGDLHQPLHTTTNDDRGGNCVPVAYFDRAPEETNPEKEDYRPNLHGVWDTNIIERFAQGRPSRQVASELEEKFKTQIQAWESEKAAVNAWALESHALAEAVVYGDLPAQIAIEKPQEVNSCADDDHIAARMLKLHEQIGEDYEIAAETAVETQLAKAGARLAGLLNSLWP
ncbi:MAG TPA: S1/P1 nuclease [Candidatus Cybelea sp.]|nr:S1/P1 nuclease [Candidatus Cybelea sp.]